MIMHEKIYNYSVLFVTLFPMNSTKWNKSLEELSNIAGAKEYPEVWNLFSVLDSYEVPSLGENTVVLQSRKILREDVVKNANENVKKIILENAPLLGEDNQIIL